MNNSKRWWVLGIFLAAVLVIFALALIASRGAFAPSLPASKAGGSSLIVGARGHRIAGRVFLVGTPARTAPIVVVLHGDAPFVKPRYQYAFAADLANAVPGTRAVALLRPGYADPFGAKSDGDRGFALGENYTASIVDELADSIQSLKSRWRASAVILVGHSGGAALAANIAALFPGLAQHVFLVGCPCDVPAFRRHMAHLQWNPLWLLPSGSLSPLETLNHMGTGTKVTAISGANDPIALPSYARSYVARATARGISASMVTIPDRGHEILNDPIVVQEVAKAIRAAS
jgi:pimeloyl-ACP methyl ester carboxylesterase